jgi:hypothetical protein
MKTKAEIKKKYRLKKAIKNILTNHLNESYFITLTFNDSVLNNTTQEKRLLYIKNFLNNQTDKYILNCDFGKQTGREHYHALAVATDKYINKALYMKKYGLIYIKPMNFYKTQNIESKTKFLLNHALKETAQDKIIYSKAKRPTHETKNKKFYDLKEVSYFHSAEFEEQERKRKLKEFIKYYSNDII